MALGRAIRTKVRGSKDGLRFAVLSIPVQSRIADRYSTVIFVGVQVEVL
jgi:hypothetical protein